MGMKKLLWLWLALTLAVLVYGFYLAIFVAPADAEQGNVFRIFYYHVPSAIMGLIFPYVNLIAALIYLGIRRNNPTAARQGGRDRAGRGGSRSGLHYDLPCHRHALGTRGLGHMVGVG